MVSSPLINAGSPGLGTRLRGLWPPSGNCMGRAESTALEFNRWDFKHQCHHFSILRNLHRTPDLSVFFCPLLSDQGDTCKAFSAVGLNSSGRTAPLVTCDFVTAPLAECQQMLSALPVLCFCVSFSITQHPVLTEDSGGWAVQHWALFGCWTPVFYSC